MVDRVKAAGWPMVTRAETPPTQEVKDDLAFMVDQQTDVAFIMAPDDTKIEFIEIRRQTAPIALHHIHFLTPQVAEMKAWYVKRVRRQARQARQFRSGRHAGRQPHLLAVSGSRRRHARTRARSHRLRDRESRGVLPEARGPAASRSISRSRVDERPRRRQRVSHRSVGDVHRPDGRVGQGVAHNARASRLRGRRARRRAARRRRDGDRAARQAAACRTRTPLSSPRCARRSDVRRFGTSSAPDRRSRFRSAT